MSRARVCFRIVLALLVIPGGKVSKRKWTMIDTTKSDPPGITETLSCSCIVLREKNTSIAYFIFDLSIQWRISTYHSKIRGKSVRHSTHKKLRNPTVLPTNKYLESAIRNLNRCYDFKVLDLSNYPVFCEQDIENKFYITNQAKSKVCLDVEVHQKYRSSFHGVTLKLSKWPSLCDLSLTDITINSRPSLVSYFLQQRNLNYYSKSDCQNCIQLTSNG